MSFHLAFVLLDNLYANMFILELMESNEENQAQNEMEENQVSHTFINGELSFSGSQTEVDFNQEGADSQNFCTFKISNFGHI